MGQWMCRSTADGLLEFLQESLSNPTDVTGIMGLVGEDMILAVEAFHEARNRSTQPSSNREKLRGIQDQVSCEIKAADDILHPRGGSVPTF